MHLEKTLMQQTLNYKNSKKNVKEIKLKQIVLEVQLLLKKERTQIQIKELNLLIMICLNCKNEHKNYKKYQRSEIMTLRKLQKHTKQLILTY